MTAEPLAEKHSRMAADAIWPGVWAYLGAMGLAAALGGFTAAFSAALGGALALANLALLERGLALLATPEANPDLAKGLAMASFFFRLFVTGGAILGFNSLGWVSFPWLALGLSVPLAGITVYYLMARPLKDWYERAY